MMGLKSFWYPADLSNHHHHHADICTCTQIILMGILQWNLLSFMFPKWSFPSWPHNLISSSTQRTHFVFVSHYLIVSTLFVLKTIPVPTHYTEGHWRNGRLIGVHGNNADYPSHLSDFHVIGVEGGLTRKNQGCYKVSYKGIFLHCLISHTYYFNTSL